MTLASVLKQANYNTYFTGKWHLGEDDYALPNAQGYDQMRYAGLYHLNACTYADPTWFPDMDPELRAMFKKVTKGSLSGDAGETATEDFAINVNFMKVHQPNLPHPDYEHESLSKSKYADSVVELDSRIGRIMDKVRELGLDENTLVIYTTDNGACTVRHRQVGPQGLVLLHREQTLSGCCPGR